MKKLLCIILSSVLIFCTCVFTANAITVPQIDTSPSIDMPDFVFCEEGGNIIYSFDDPSGITRTFCYLCSAKNPDGSDFTLLIDYGGSVYCGDAVKYYELDGYKLVAFREYIPGYYYILADGKMSELSYAYENGMFDSEALYKQLILCDDIPGEWNKNDNLIVTSPNAKITQALSQALDDESADVISVYISLKQTVSESQIEQIVSENYTWTTAQEYLKYYRQEVKKAATAHTDAFLAENGALIENIIFKPLFAEFLIADVKRENIPALAALDDVIELSYFEDLVPDVEAVGDNLYLNEFAQWSLGKYGSDWDCEDYSYNELYYHKNESGETDWVLVNARYYHPEPTVEDRMLIGGIGGRVLYSGSINSPFRCCYGIYDVDENEFFGLDEIPEGTKRIDEVLDVLEALDIGYISGDVNGDTRADVLDATAIQKASVEKIELSKAQNVIADVNTDKKADILDAVAIQKAAVA